MNRWRKPHETYGMNGRSFDSPASRRARSGFRPTGSASVAARAALCAMLGVGCWYAALGSASAASYEGQRVIQVDVRGAKTVAKETVLAKVQLKPGAPYQEAIVSEDLRRLFSLGYFTDVKADVEPLPDGLRLIFLVTEKPSIASVDVRGARLLRKAKVLELLGVKPGQLYDPRKVKEGIDKLKAEYARRGFAQCEVVSQMGTDAATNTAALDVVIDEGPRMRVTQILVEGNQAFPDRRIIKLLKTRARKWWFFGTYNEQVVQEDLERVKAFYRKDGYQDVEAVETTARDPSGRGLVVHFQITEGLQHRVGQVTITGAVLFPERELRRVMTLKPGAVYTTDALQEDLRAIKQYYGDRGYIHAEVVPDPQLDAGTKRVNLSYQLIEHELVYVNRVEVQGNLRTKDTVIRREMRIYPGDPFDGAKIRKSLDRLYNLGYFEEVNVETQPTQTSKKEDVVVKVKESKTGSFSFGGGFSSVDRLVGLIELEQRNFDWRNWRQFTGAGQDLRLRIEVGTVRRSFDLSFTEPWIFGHPVSFGIDAYNRTRLRQRNLGLAFEEQQRGVGFRLGKEFADRVQVGLSYQLFRTEISNVVNEASTDLKAEAGRANVSEVGASIALDDRNNKFDPTKGYYLFTSGDLAGGLFAGDRDFYRVQAGASSYLPHGSRGVFEARLRGGLVRPYGDTDAVPIFERFFGGGSGTIRGFRERRVGPIDPSSNDPIGGEATFLVTLEEVVAIAKDERGRSILRGSVFYDVGNVWRKTGDFGSSFKSGTGVGARVNTPIGPLRLDVGFPLTDVAGEKRRPRFHFNISRSF